MASNNVWYFLKLVGRYENKNKIIIITDCSIILLKKYTCESGCACSQLRNSAIVIKEWENTFMSNWPIYTKISYIYTILKGNQNLLIYKNTLILDSDWNEVG